MKLRTKKWIGIGIIVGFIFTVGIPAVLAHFYSSEIANYFLKDTLGDLKKSGVDIHLLRLGLHSSDIEVSIPEHGIHALRLHPQYSITSFLHPTVTFRLAFPLKDKTKLKLLFEAPHVEIFANFRKNAPLTGTILITDLSKNKNALLKIMENHFTIPLLEETGELMGSGDTVIEYGKNSYPLSIKKVEWALAKVDNRLRFTARFPNESTAIDSIQLDEDIVLTVEHTNSNNPLVVSLQSGEALALNGQVVLPNNIQGGEAKFFTSLDFNSYPDLLAYVPLVAESVTQIAGVINANMLFSNGFSSSEMSVKTSDLSGVAMNLPFKGLSFNSEIKFLPVVRSKKEIKMSLARFGGEVYLENLNVSASLPSTSKLQIKSLNAHFCNGKISAIPFDYDLKKSIFDARLKINGIDIEELLLRLKLDSVVANGKLDGFIEIKKTPLKIQIEKLQLKNQHPGHLQYKEPSVQEIPKNIDYLDEFNDLLARGQQALVYKALDNFDYSELKINAERSERGELDFFIHLKGKNPDLAKGQPFEINLPVSGNVESLLEQSLIKSFLENSTWEEKLKEMQDSQSQ